MRDDGRDVCLRVLGLAPGASEQEIKTAYRDLAKVWHPDRFAHDPRLQQKAQEQLKEINDAYARLASGDFARPHARSRASARPASDAHPPRAAHTPPRAPNSNGAQGDSQATRAATTTVDARVATRATRRVSRVAIAAPAIAFCATFAFVTPRLLSNARAPEHSSDAAAVASPARGERDESARQPSDSGAEAAGTADAHAQQKNQTTNRQQSIQTAESATTATAAQPLRAIATVTVAIDPTTGLRARSGCPHKSAITFPAGDEPTAYCDAHNAAATATRTATDDARADKSDDARGKSFAGRISSSARKLFGSRPSSDKEPARDNNSPRN